MAGMQLASRRVHQQPLSVLTALAIAREALALNPTSGWDSRLYLLFSLRPSHSSHTSQSAAMFAQTVSARSFVGVAPKSARLQVRSRDISTRPARAGGRGRGCSGDQKQLPGTFTPA